MTAERNAPVTNGDEMRVWLLATLRRLAPAFPGEMNAATPIADGGLEFDSLALHELIGLIEERLDTIVDERDITEQQFGTVGAVLQFLKKRSHRQPDEIGS